MNLKEQVAKLKADRERCEAQGVPPNISASLAALESIAAGIVQTLDEAGLIKEPAPEPAPAQPAEGA